LVMVNPGASRAEAALPALSSWFTERCDAVIVVSNSKKERKRKLKADGKDADLIERQVCLVGCGVSGERWQWTLPWGRADGGRGCRHR
jgi:hypothetical protein